MTLAILSVVTIVAIVVGTLIYRKTRPQQYRPDEQSEDITSSLTRNLPPDAPKPKFTDVTREAGLSEFRTFVGDRTSQLPEDMGSGAAWGDFNNDGLDDLFLVSAGGPLTASASEFPPCALYRNMGDGTFKKVTGFAELRIHGMGASWGDYDGDGFLDLFVTGYNTTLLFRNEGGTGKFVRDVHFPDLKGFWSSGTWGDYDNDRVLDLYVCGYVQYDENDADRAKASEQLGTFVPYTLNPSSYKPAKNLLFHNNGDGTFTEVAEKLGVTNPEGRSLGALWQDFDDDGRLDLYIANDISDNVLYHNTGGKFEDISHAALVADYRSAMGLTAGDFDRDGDDDLHIAHWVGQENALYENMLVALNKSSTTTVERAATPLRFMDVADMKGLGQIAIPYIGWGTEFVDFDGDGWLDLIVVNGSTLEEDGPPPRKMKPQEAFLFWNRHGEYFHDLAPLNKSLSEKHVSRGMAVADYNNDGAMDILIVDHGEGVRLLRNDMQTGHWLKVRLHSLNKSGKPLGFGDGSKVIAHLGDVALRRTVSSVSYLSQSSHTLHFGLGSATKVDKLEVRWLGGGTNVFENFDANVTWEITEGDPMPKKISATTAAPTQPVSPEDRKVRLIEFWNRHRAGMNAMKVEKDLPKAINLFRGALELDPKHEDARYYLGQCLAMQGDSAGALAQLSELTRINPQSHRGFQQWGRLRAIFATSAADLDAAEKSLEKAQALNPEETGALLVLGEISLLRGDLAKANERLTAACRSNPKAVGGFFLRGFIAWKNGDTAQAQKLLEDTRTALGKDWQPKGATAEGDVKQKQYLETTPLTRFWERWDGIPDLAKTYAALDQYLTSKK